MSAIIRRMVPAANLTLLYGGLPVEARFEAARADGFNAVEILFPYDHSPQWYADRLAQHGLQLALLNTPIDTTDSRWGYAALPGRQAAFQEGFLKAAEVCEATGCEAVHVMAGCVGGDNPEARKTLLQNLAWAAGRHPEIRLQLEALNTFDVPGYYYSHPAAVRQVLDAAQGLNAGLQFDFYHVVRQGLGLLRELDEALPYIRHVQVAGSPTRTEPDLARDSLHDGFQCLHEAGYRGYVGYEYRPAGSITEGLRWATPLSNYFSPQSHRASRL